MPTVYNKVTANGNTLIDLSQDTVTQASHIIAGLVGHLADGTQVTGTGGGGSGGLVYESGTYTPASNNARPTISFTNTHAKPPMLIMLSDATGTSDTTTNTNYAFLYADFYRFTGNGIPYSSSVYNYGSYGYGYRGNSTTTTNKGLSMFEVNSDTTGSNQTYPCYFATAESFYPYTLSTSRYWRSGRTYKWVAVWAPTT